MYVYMCIYIYIERETCIYCLIVCVCCFVCVVVFVVCLGRWCYDILVEYAMIKVVYTSRFVRVILAQGPC